jgi:hypothetical protein
MRRTLLKPIGWLLKFLLLALALLPWALQCLPGMVPQPLTGWQVDPIVMFAVSSISLLLILFAEIWAKIRWRHRALQGREQLSISQTTCDELQEQISQQAVAYEDTLAQERNVVRARAAQLQLQQEEHHRQNERDEWELHEREKKVAARESYVAERDKRLKDEVQNFEVERANYEEALKQERLAFESQQREMDRQSRNMAENEKRQEAELDVRLARLRESEETLAEEKKLFEQSCLAWTKEKKEAESSLRKERTEFDRKAEELREELKYIREDLAAKEQWIEAQKEQLAERRSQWEATRREETVKLEARAHELKELAWHLKQQQERQAKDRQTEDVSPNDESLDSVTSTFVDRNPLQRERELSMPSPQRAHGEPRRNVSGNGNGVPASQNEPPHVDETESCEENAPPPSANEQDPFEESLEVSSIESPQDDPATNGDASNDNVTDADEKQPGSKPVIAHRLRQLGKKRRDRARGVYRSRKPR